MKQSFSERPAYSAFTLIELLVVISIIAVLAALTIPITKGLKNQRMKRVGLAEMIQLETAIQSYKSKTGIYPPDNPASPLYNQLYFELAGGFFNPATNGYTTLDGSGQISGTSLAAISGGRVSGLANSSTSVTGSDDRPAPINALKDAQLKPKQTETLTVAGVDVKMLVCSVGWAGDAGNSPTGNEITPWRYVSSNPTNNPTSYDLWVDLLIDGKTNRISNWSKTPQIVP
jgi:prepilin-type N-terminal cleavage/methylation domain-containing protein